MKRSREENKDSRPHKVVVLSAAKQVFLPEEEDSEEEVSFITAHLNPDAVIWSENVDVIPLHPGKFMVGWSLDKGEEETAEQPNETMFLVQKKPEEAAPSFPDVSRTNLRGSVCTNKHKII